MNDFPWLTILIVVPLLGAVATAALPAGHRLELPKLVALGTSLLTLLLALIMSFGYDLNGGFQFTEDHVWIKEFGEAGTPEALEAAERLQPSWGDLEP